jgi:hypothetical protein
VLLLNFGHPLTERQLESIAALTGQPLARCLDITVQFDATHSFIEQAQALVDSLDVEPEAWQTLPLLVNLPGMSVIAGLVLAELHGRCGYFPSVLRLRPVSGTFVPQYEVAEIAPLQNVRDTARQRREDEGRK